MTLYLLKISAFTHIYININNQFNMEVNTEGEAPRTRKKKKDLKTRRWRSSYPRHLAQQKRSDVFTFHFPQLRGCGVHGRQRQRLLSLIGCNL